MNDCFAARRIKGRLCGAVVRSEPFSDLGVGRSIKEKWTVL
jgi:hypothetical protein